MDRQRKPLTDAEKIALHYHVFCPCDDWYLIFKVAKGAEYYNALTDKARQPRVSEWKNSAKVKEEVKKLQYLKQRQEEEQKERNRLEWDQEERAKETESTETNEKRRNTYQTDFLNRDEFLKFLNTRANEITDDKLRNDILKMLSDNMRYKESEKDENNEIQRFYTPVTCENCSIYQKCKGCKLSECPNLSK